MMGGEDVGDPREWDEDLEAAKRGDWESIGLDAPARADDEGGGGKVAQGFERVGIDDLVPVHELEDPGARNPRHP